MNQTLPAFHARTRLALLLGAGSLLAGCASVPDLPASPALLPASQLQSQQTLPDSHGEWAGAHWWQRYQDPQLDQLMQEALAQSPSLDSARARPSCAASPTRRRPRSRICRRPRETSAVSLFRRLSLAREGSS